MKTMFIECVLSINHHEAEKEKENMVRHNAI